MGVANSPGLERKYSTALANYIAELQPGECLYWRPDGWYKSEPGIAFVKTEDGSIKPVKHAKK